MKGTQSLPPSEIRGIPVVFDPRMSFVAHAAGLWPLKRIKVGWKWLELDAKTQRAVLLHEVHHCRALHMEVRWLLILVFWTKWAQRIAWQQELDADRYVARQGYAKELARFIAEHPAAHAPFHPTSLERLNCLGGFLQGAA